MADPNKEYVDTKKSKSKKDKAKIELAEKMAKRKKTSPSDMLQTIKIQERFDKDPVSRKTDMIGDDKLTTDFQKGGRVNFKGGGCAKRGVKKNAYGKNS
jgi:DNA replicative helicase MCM subunit Mcm2 (Cdc46/Mcm family)